MIVCDVTCDLTQNGVYGQYVKVSGILSLVVLSPLL